MNLFRETLKSLLRHGLTTLFGWLILPLIVKGVIGSDLGAQLRAAIDGWAGIIAGTIITLLTPLLLAWWNKVKAKVKVIIAAELDPKIATDFVIEQEAAALSKDEKFRKATAPGDIQVPR